MFLKLKRVFRLLCYRAWGALHSQVGEPEDEYASDNGGAQHVMRMNAEMMALGAPAARGGPN